MKVINDELVAKVVARVRAARLLPTTKLTRRKLSGSDKAELLRRLEQHGLVVSPRTVYVSHPEQLDALLQPGKQFTRTQLARQIKGGDTKQLGLAIATLARDERLRVVVRGNVELIVGLAEPVLTSDELVQLTRWHSALGRTLEKLSSKAGPRTLLREDLDVARTELRFLGRPAVSAAAIEAAAIEGAAIEGASDGATPNSTPPTPADPSDEPSPEPRSEPKEDDEETLLSHVLLTPMNGINGLITLLRQTELSEEQHEYTKLLEHSADALLRVLHGMLGMTQASDRGAPPPAKGNAAALPVHRLASERPSPVAAPPIHVPASEVFDRDAALQSFQGDGQLLTELSQIFLDQIPAQRATLASALRVEDFGKLELTAQAIQSSATTLHAAEATEAAVALIDQVRRRDIARARVALNDLGEAIHELSLVLRPIAKEPMP